MSMKTKNPIEKNGDGTCSWTHETGDLYAVTGIDCKGRRLSGFVYTSYMHACCVNLWRGSRWLVRNGKRYRIETIFQLA